MPKYEIVNQGVFTFIIKDPALKESKLVIGGL